MNRVGGGPGCAGSAVAPAPMWAAVHVVVCLGSLATPFNLMAAVAGALAWMDVQGGLVWFSRPCARSRSDACLTQRNLCGVGGGAGGRSAAGRQGLRGFQPQIFDVALLMACCDLLTYARSKRTCVYVLCFCYGAGMAEFAAVSGGLPVMAVFAVVVEGKLEWCRVGRLFGTAVLAALALAGVHAFAARQFVLSRGLEVTLQAMLHVTVSVLREQAQAIGQMFPEHLWFPVFVLGLGSAH